ncbi:RNA-binding protein 44-like [Haemorhous mexicanus]|uniref:RNA-binding protein 44-like n=1 Tax=Haemorhous mexicanus TaxID=30427 RepID=UPI0028BD57E6|nr:RNA-binding protein 44-like [Haemorhous mexicanus]
MEVEKSSRRSCFTQTSCLGADLGEDSQLEYLSAHEEYEEDKNNWSEFSEQEEVGEVKATPLVGDKVPPQITAGEEDSGKSQRPTHSVAVEPDIPFLPSREEAQLSKHGEPSYFSSCEKPAVCTRGTSSTAEDAETQLPVPEILPGKNPGAGMEAAEKSSGGSPKAVNSERGEALRSVASVTVDAGSDSRAGFPTSRSSSAQVCLCSRAVSTEVTMMSRTQPLGWLGQTSVDAASNTEWPLGALSSHLQQESKDHLSDRPEHPNKQTGKNSASSCCQNILQRATEAELQLLAVHYEMCYQHCLKVYELALEENTCLGTYFNSCEKKAEFYSSLLLVLDELDKNYSNMRREINMGIPLNELPPLSVELKFSPLSSFYIPSKFFRKSLYSEQAHDRTGSGSPSSDLLDLSGEGKADFEEPKRQEKGISVNMDNSQTDGDQPGDSASSETWEELLKDQALERGCVKNEEGSEYWFDAKEDLSVADISVMCKEMKKQQGRQDSREVKIVVSGKEHSSVPVGGSKPSVPEDPGENSLQKISTSSFVKPSGIFVSPYALNLSSFTKLVRRLQEKHPGFSRGEIVEAVQEVRKMNKGVLSGLAISSIEEKASAILRGSTRCSQQKHSRGSVPVPLVLVLQVSLSFGVSRAGRERGRSRAGPRPSRARPSGSAAGAEPARPRERSRSCRGAMALLPRRFLCFVLAQHFIAATACQEADYGALIRHHCLRDFQHSMEGISQHLWCDWDQTVGTYGELTNCTALIAEKLDCYWPNRLVDEFFVAVHKQYFRNCSPSGRALHDPPNGVLCPFIVLPVLVTLLMTALVVWRSKRSEGIV